MEITHVVASNVKKLREQRKLTLDAAAECTGVSRSMLAQIEKGIVNPTISVLWKIANGYKVSFTSLIEDKAVHPDIIRAAQATPVTEGDGRYLNYPTFAFDEEKSFECYRIVILPGGSLHAQPHLKGAQEYITVYSGSVEIQVDSNAYRLGPGDSIRFMADVPHAYRNPGAAEAQLSMLIYYNKS